MTSLTSDAKIKSKGKIKTGGLTQWQLSESTEQMGRETLL